MVFNVDEKADKVTGVIKPDGRGNHWNHYRVISEDKENVLSHIKSFPLVDSHYCRAKTNKKYYRMDLTSRKYMSFAEEIAEKMKGLWSNHLTTDSSLTHVLTSLTHFIFLRQIVVSVAKR